MMTDNDLTTLHRRLGIPADYGVNPYRPRFMEAKRLVAVGEDLFARPQRLAPEAALRWRALQAAAAADGVSLQLVSAFRSIAYQAALIERKLAARQAIDAILTVVAAPGFSEHHTGCAVDLTTPGCDPLTESFGDTDAFRWLMSQRDTFGLRLSYPPDNSSGFIYEPWHWALLTPKQKPTAQ